MLIHMLNECWTWR